MSQVDHKVTRPSRSGLEAFSERRVLDMQDRVAVQICHAKG